MSVFNRTINRNFNQNYYVFGGAHFDGTNDKMTLGGDLTGIVDGKQGTASVWHRIDGGDGVGRRFLVNNGASPRFSFTINSGNTFRTFARNTAGTQILQLDTSATYTTGPTLYHIISSWDLTDTTKRHMYINDVSDLAVTTYTNDNIDYTFTDWGIGGRPDSNVLLLNGPMFELWFHTTYIDLSITSNRRKFITERKKPAFLGNSGELPLDGVTPLVYMKNPYSSFNINSGSGGNFTVTGSLTEPNINPSN